MRMIANLNFSHLSQWTAQRQKREKIAKSLLTMHMNLRSGQTETLIGHVREKSQMRDGKIGKQA